MEKRRLLTTLAGMAAIVIVAAVLGYTYPTVRGSTELEINSWPTVTSPTPEPISLSDLKGKVDQGGKVALLDARSREEYEAGHIKGAISLPVFQFQESFDSVRDRLNSATEIVTYGSGNTPDLGQSLSEALIGKGFTQVKVFSGGWSAWRAAGYSSENGGPK